MIKTISHMARAGNFHKSLDIVASHNGARFAIPFAKEYCKGFGYDIGAGKREWMFPGAIPIDPQIELVQSEKEELLFQMHGERNFKYFEGYYHADLLPNCQVDYIFSSHTLEHLPNPYATLEYWHEKLNDGGILFLYLPSYQNTYWRPWHNKKHIHVMDPVVLKDCLTDLGFFNIFVSQVDLNESFMIIASK